MRKNFALGIAVILILVAIFSFTSIVEMLDAKQILVVQYPNGTLRVGTQPGIYMQWFGTVTKYHKRDQFWFSNRSDQDKKTDESLTVRFNDGGHAKISGSIAWEMPITEKNIIALHVRYGSHEAIEQQLMRTVIEKSVYMTGPLMSSAESYAARRNELLNLLDDQIVNGVFKTEATTERVKDTMTGIEKTIVVVRLIKGRDGKYLRQDNSPLDEFGIKTFNLSINNVKYDPTVEKQIEQQQQAVMQVQTAIARAKEAEQEAITVAKKGEAEAAGAKWRQEVIKATEVTKAEQERAVAVITAQKRVDVAKQTRLEAEQKKLAAVEYKQEQILRGQGEAKKKRLILEADGALQQKLETYRAVMGKFAEEFAKQKWVPEVQMGSSGQVGTGNAAANLIDLLTAKTLKDLGLDMSVPAGRVPKK